MKWKVKQALILEFKGKTVDYKIVGESNTEFKVVVSRPRRLLGLFPGEVIFIEISSSLSAAKDVCRVFEGS